MPKALLNEEQVARLILANKYSLEEKIKFLSRCIDGRYEREKNLPALAIPGADAGELAVMLAAVNVYGLQIEPAKAFKALVDVVGGVENLRFHTDTHAPKGVVCGGCGYIREVKKDPGAFNLTGGDVEFILKKAEEAKKKGAQEILLTGEHEEGAIVSVSGPFGLYNKHLDGGDNKEIFVFHSGLVNERHRALAKKLTKTQEDEDYLYSVYSDTIDNHLFEIAKRLAKGLPIYGVNFDAQGSFDLEFQGNVI